VLTTDNVRTGCSYPARRPSAARFGAFDIASSEFQVQITLFFPPPADCSDSKGSGVSPTLRRVTSMLMEEPLLYLLAANVITLGRLQKPKVLKSCKRRAEGSAWFLHITPSFLALRKRVKEVSAICISFVVTLEVWVLSLLMKDGYE